jgi:hypothetical protein
MNTGVYAFNPTGVDNETRYEPHLNSCSLLTPLTRSPSQFGFAFQLAQPIERNLPSLFRLSNAFASTRDARPRSSSRETSLAEFVRLCRELRCANDNEQRSHARANNRLSCVDCLDTAQIYYDRCLEIERRETNG